MTAAQAWREMLAADQRFLAASMGYELGEETGLAYAEALNAHTDAHAAFDKAVGVWDRA